MFLPYANVCIHAFQGWRCRARATSVSLPACHACGHVSPFRACFCSMPLENTSVFVVQALLQKKAEEKAKERAELRTLSREDQKKREQKELKKASKNSMTKVKIKVG
jgi:hypothetical protein